VARHAGVGDAVVEGEGVHPGRRPVPRAAAEGEAEAEDRALVEDAGEGAVRAEDVVLQVDELVEAELDDGRVVVDVAPRSGQRRQLDDLPEREGGDDLHAELERQRGEVVGAVAGGKPGLLPRRRRHCTLPPSLHWQLAVLEGNRRAPAIFSRQVVFVTAFFARTPRYGIITSGATMFIIMQEFLTLNFYIGTIKMYNK
jgi:hypothetical protein